MNPDRDRFRLFKATFRVAFFFGALRPALAATLVLCALDRDRYERLVGTARRGDGWLVNLAMIEQGAAFVYPHASDKDGALTGSLLEAQVAAMERGIGFWPSVLRSRDAGRVHPGNRGTKRFHALSCPLGGEVRESDRIRFSSLREAFEAGFARRGSAPRGPRNGAASPPQPESCP